MHKTDLEAQSHQNIETFADDKLIRHNFITKVYSILTAQVTYTVAIVIAFVNVDELRKFAVTNRNSLLLINFIVGMGVYFALCCITSLRRSYPLNYALLFVFTTANSLQVSVLSVLSKIENVYISCFLTAGLFIFLTGFAYLNIIDLTNFGCILFVASLILAFLSAGAWFAGVVFNLQFPALTMALCVCILLLVLVYIVFDTQLIIGEGRVKLSEEEYIVAAIDLYIDLIMLFKLILTILNSTQGD